MLSIVPKSELQNVNLTPVRQVYKIYIGSLYIQYLYIYIFIYLISIFINVYFYTFQAITMLPGVVCHLSKQNHCQSLWSHTRQVSAKFKQEPQDGAPPPPFLQGSKPRGGAFKKTFNEIERTLKKNIHVQLSFKKGSDQDPGHLLDNPDGWSQFGSVRYRVYNAIFKDWSSSLFNFYFLHKWLTDKSIIFHFVALFSFLPLRPKIYRLLSLLS